MANPFRSSHVAKSTSEESSSAPPINEVINELHQIINEVGATVQDKSSGGGASMSNSDCLSLDFGPFER